MDAQAGCRIDSNDRSNKHITGPTGATADRFPQSFAAIGKAGEVIHI
jgi:hypothetical protein